MRFTSLTTRIAGDTADAWDLHNRAMDRQANGENIIVLSIGQEADEQTPQHIVDAAISSLQRGRHHYTHVEGEPELREAIANYHTSMTGQSVNANNCTVHTGAQNALYAVAQCLLEPGDEVILSEPYYTTYPATFTASGATAVGIEVLPEHGYVMQPAAIIHAITPKTRVIVLNSPANPLGTIYSREQFEPIVKACLSHNIWLISDEVYSALLEPDVRASPAAVPGADRVCVTISSLSKSHRMTGWRIGWAVGPVALAEHIANLSMCMHYGLPPFIMDAAVQALKSDETATSIRTAMTQRRAIVNESLRTGPAVTLIDGGSGMFIVLDVSATGLSAKTFATGLLDQHAVATLPCDGFGPAGRDLLRVGLCVDGEQLRVACKRISSYIESIGQTSV